MLKNLICLLTLALVLGANVWAQKIEPPTLTAKELTKTQEDVVRNAIALRKEKKYDQAIPKIEQVLTENPDSPIALYHLSYTYYLKPDYPKALEIAFKAARYKGEALKDVYGLIGTIYDDSKNPQKAVEVYQFALKQYPDDYLLHYNLGLTLYRQNNYKDARESLKRAATLNDNHASSQLLLADIFFKNRYRVPALLAAMNFFLLEPNTPRTDVAVRIINNVLQGGAAKGAKPNEINITLDPDSPKDEGDFGAVELVLGLGKAAGMTKEEMKGKSEAQLLAEQLETFIVILDESKDKDATKFVWRQYLPLFVEMKNRKHIEVFANMLRFKTGDEAARKWLTENENKLTEFAKWLQGYKLPTAK